MSQTECLQAQVRGASRDLRADGCSSTPASRPSRQTGRTAQAEGRRPTATGPGILARISHPVPYRYDLGAERVCCLPLNSQGRNPADAVWSVPPTREETALS